jgi:hypothetical protein
LLGISARTSLNVAYRWNCRFEVLELSKRKRILAWATGFVVVLFAYGWLFGVALLFAVQARYTGWKVPVVRKTPVELADTSISPQPGF